ncbi:OLC1v1030460C1 [Oldenlandia corymbosa var. corymbosa]|uniref:OLC1v1030460C1 n=1 Tax=Oldenlandia corymbosa var. corymbosa TaxID=529605 RepID=A0AAV1CJQ2_OLDCO|nr:OLC1v1030460C1 [Oldenlandia corymbosa var. corymbosa]
MPSTSFQDWYIVKRNLASSSRKRVEGYGGSPIWKPNFLYEAAPEKYRVAWNYREVNGYEAIKDEWTDEDEEMIHEFGDNLKKLKKYSKVIMSSSNAGSRLFGDEDPFPIVNSDEEVTATAVAGQKKKKRQIETMHDAMVKVLTKLSIEQLPLWEALSGAVAKMNSPSDISSFPGDAPTILAQGPSEEEPIPDVPDEYMGIELEYADDEAIEEDVADTGHSGVQRKGGETSQSKDTSPDRDADGWSIHRVHLMVLSEEQAKEFPLYSMISGIMTGRADIHSVETIEKLEVDLLDVIFIAAMDMLKERVQEVELLMGYISDLQNLLLDHQIDFPIFEKPEVVADPRTRSSREELLMRVHAQDEETVDLKDKLNQCVNLLSQHGFKGIIRPSPDNPIREVLVRV